MRLRWGARLDVACGVRLGASSSVLRTKLVVISNAHQQRISEVSQVELCPCKHAAVWLAYIAVEWGNAVVFSDKELLDCRL